jgi:hypothetical protein
VIVRNFCTILQNDAAALARGGGSEHNFRMSSIADLAALVARHVPRTGMVSTPIHRLSLFRADEPTVPLSAVYDASDVL